MDNLHDILFGTRGDRDPRRSNGAYQMSEGLKEAAEETREKIREAFDIRESKTKKKRSAKKHKAKVKSA